MTRSEIAKLASKAYERNGVDRRAFRELAINAGFEGRPGGWIYSRGNPVPVCQGWSALAAKARHSGWILDHLAGVKPAAGHRPADETVGKRDGGEGGVIEMHKICRTCGETLRYVNADGFEYYSHEGAPRGHHATPTLPREAAHEKALIENARRAAAVPVSEYMIQARAIIRDSGCADRPHAYALGFVAQTLCAAANGHPINRERALLAYAVYLAVANRSPADDVMPTHPPYPYTHQHAAASGYAELTDPHVD